MGVSRVFSGRLKVFPGSFRVSWGCFKEVSRVFTGCFKGFLRNFQGGVKGVSSVFHGFPLKF